jgi:hypothetical protein
MIVPLGAFAEDNSATGRCDLWLELLDEETQPESTHILFGSLFLQQYINWWSYDYSSGKAVETFRMQLSPTNTLTYSYIGKAIYLNSNVSPFLYPSTTQTINVNVDRTTKATTIDGMLGYQGYSQFGVSLLGQYIETYSDQCY